VLQMGEKTAAKHVESLKEPTANQNLSE
jgi:hypothetical protein